MNRKKISRITQKKWGRDFAHVPAVQKVLSGSGRAGRLRLMGKYIGHRLVARPELDNTFWTNCTATFFSCLIPCFLFCGF